MAKYPVTLIDEERVTLENIIKNNKSNSLRTKRAYILLACDSHSGKHQSTADIATRYYVSNRFVEKLRKRFVEESFELALNGKQWGGYKEKTFAGYAKWTLRLLASPMVELSYVESISHTSIDTILKKTKQSLGRLNLGRSAAAVIPEADSSFVAQMAFSSLQ